MSKRHDCDSGKHAFHHKGKSLIFNRFVKNIGVMNSKFQNLLNHKNIFSFMSFIFSSKYHEV